MMPEAIEDIVLGALRDRGCPIVLSDERAVSQKRSPFRTVTTLVEYIGSLLQAEQA
jgi:hypothetical protein